MQGDKQFFTMVPVGVTSLTTFQEVGSVLAPGPLSMNVNTRIRKLSLAYKTQDRNCTLLLWKVAQRLALCAKQSEKSPPEKRLHINWIILDITPFLNGLFCRKSTIFSCFEFSMGSWLLREESAIRGSSSKRFKTSQTCLIMPCHADTFHSDNLHHTTRNTGESWFRLGTTGIRTQKVQV